MLSPSRYLPKSINQPPPPPSETVCRPIPPKKRRKGNGWEENVFLDHGTWLLVTISINQSLKRQSQYVQYLVFGSLSEIKKNLKTAKWITKWEKICDKIYVSDQSIGPVNTNKTSNIFPISMLWRQVYIFCFIPGDQEQVHRSGGGLRVRQLLQRSAGAHGHAPAQRQDHAILPATNQVQHLLTSCCHQLHAYSELF